MGAMLKSVLLWLCVSMVTAHEMLNGGLISNERKLYDDLMKNYNKFVRPVTNDKDTLEVRFSISLVAIEDLIEKEQTLVMHAWLKYMWVDTQLSWDPAKSGDLKEIRLPIDQIWSPDLTLYNSMEKGIYDQADGGLAVVHANGKGTWNNCYNI